MANLGCLCDAYNAKAAFHGGADIVGGRPEPTFPKLPVQQGLMAHYPGVLIIELSGCEQKTSLLGNRGHAKNNGNNPPERTGNTPNHRLTRSLEPYPRNR